MWWKLTFSSRLMTTIYYPHYLLSPLLTIPSIYYPHPPVPSPLLLFRIIKDSKHPELQLANARDLCTPQALNAVLKLELLLDRTMYLWWSFYTLYLLASQVRVTVGDSGLYCCVSVKSFER